MKETVEDKMLRELFRRKLENAEITPSAEAGAKLMSRLGRREFLRFNPSRFNIWYAGTMAVAGASIVIALISHKPEAAPAVFVEKQSETLSTEPAAAQSNAKPAEKKVAILHNERKQAAGNERTAASIHVKVQAPDINKRSAVEPVKETGMLKDALGNAKSVSELNHKYVSLSGASVTEGCAPLKVAFRNLSAVYDSCRWTFGDGGSSAEKNPTWIFDVPGEYKVTLTISGSGGQVSSSSLNVIVHGHPEARFEYTPLNAVLPTDEVSFHNYSGDAVRYRWDFGDGTTSELFEPTHIYSKAGKYTVKMVALSDYGCTDSVIVKNAFAGTGNYINFPNAFIPNLNGPSSGTYSQKSDESAQVFHPVSSGVSEYQLRIFSRRGILIFESNDVSIGWDGYLKGQLCEPGVYIWKARGTFLNGETFTRMGDVTLLKY